MVNKECGGVRCGKLANVELDMNQGSPMAT
jgi:hypothetical protein